MKEYYISISEMPEYDTFETICQQQKVNTLDVLNEYMKQYNIDHQEVYEQAIKEWWNS